MPVFEPLPGVRVVADPAAIDALVAALPAQRPHLRLAPDDVLVIGTAGVAVDDPDAIVEPEAGFVAAEVDLAVVARHTEWPHPGRAAGRRPGRDRGRAGPSLAGPRRRAGDADHRRGLRRRAGRAPRTAAVSEYTETLPPIRWADEPKPAYDVVIIGGGGHGLSTAYHLAARHGITNVAVLEADYIASGNTGRNTTIIRANYGIPEAIRFYQHSLELYQGLEAETGAAILHQTKGIVWLAHTEMAMRTERARAAMNQACGAQTFMRDAAGAQGAHPAARPGRRRPLPGHGRLAPCRGRDGPPRPGRVGVRERGLAARGGPVPAHAGDGHHDATATG